jgi:hypothetical protein
MGKPFKREPSKAPFLKGGGQVPQQSVDDLPPAFSFEKMQDCSGNSFNCCQDVDRLQMGHRIFKLSRMPWRQIRQAPSKGLGAEKIDKTAIQRPIPGCVTEDVTFFYSLHYVGKKRFVGYRIGQIFYILWIDHTFQVYDHGS